MSEKYDVIIIGAGIGGLVCGCYLAKAGMKVLIVEKNNKPGGCCTSFQYGEYIFNAGTHAFGGYRKGGSLYNIVSYLGLEKKMQMHRAELTDIIKTPFHNIEVWNDINKTKENITKNFPKEWKNILTFFDMVNNENSLVLYSKFKNKTFQEVLNVYFTDPKLKSILSVFLGNMGLPAGTISAVTGIMLFREFVFDGGYYVIGGIQLFANRLAQFFLQNGGKFIFSQEVKAIEIANNIAKGVILNDGKFIKCIYVISNCDGMTTFFQLINKKFLSENTKRIVNSLKTSISAFIVYLAVEKNLRDNFKNKSYSLWYCKDYEINRLYANLFKGSINRVNDFVLCSCPSFYDRSLSPSNGEAITLITGAPYKNEAFWKKNEVFFAESLIKLAEEVLGNFSNEIKGFKIATPITINKFTSNTKGALYGWASVPNQNQSYSLFHKHGIKNLLTVGHWSLSPFGQGGISMVSHSGYSVAKSILKNK